MGAHGRTDGRKGHRDGEASPTAGLHSFIIKGLGGRVWEGLWEGLWNGLWEGRVWGLTDGRTDGRDTRTGRLHRPPASTHHS
jgi:hypothetical protein